MRYLILKIVRIIRFWWEWKHPIRSVKRMCAEVAWRVKVWRMPAKDDTPIDGNKYDWPRGYR